MLGFDIVTAHGATTAVAEGAKKITARAHERGLILLGCGTQSEAIRLLYPLTIPDAILEEGLTILQAALKKE